jgi:Fatty acid hydroxylase superfamily
MELTNLQIFGYYIHRFILHPSSPNLVSKLHNSYFHSVTAPFSFAAHYDHPASYLLFRFLPVYLPSVIFRIHLLTYLLLLSIVTLEETLTLSGYTTIPGIMLGGITRRQDLHSECRGRGNYAPWGLLDWLHGTSIGPDVIDDAKDEAKKHRVKERSGKALENAKESGRQGLKSWNARRKSGKQVR